jgi:hypothetical protein
MREKETNSKCAEKKNLFPIIKPHAFHLPCHRQNIANFSRAKKKTVEKQQTEGQWVFTRKSNNCDEIFDTPSAISAGS